MVCTFSGNREETLVGYVYGEMMPGERQAFESHLAVCLVCREEVAAFGEVRGNMAEWTPPTFSHQLVSPRAADTAPLAAGASQAPTGWASVPVWAQAIAAMLVLGVAAGAANVNIHHDASGLTIRTGWMATPAVATPQGADAPWRAELASLASELRAERSAAVRTVADRASQDPRPANADAELLRQVKALLAESEKKGQNELALRIAQVSRDTQAERNADILKIDRMFGMLQNNATFEVARNREAINTLAVRVAQTVR